MGDSDSPGDILYYAAEGSQADIERLVKRHREWITHRDNRGRTAAMHAAIADNVRNLQFLMRKGLSLWDTDNGGATPLHWAAQCGSAKVVRFILQAGKSPQGLSPFLVADKDGVTPIHIAACGNGKILQLFIDAVSATDDVFGLAQDKRGRGPLHYAASKASVESVRLILDSPALGLPVDARDSCGLTPLMCAVGVPSAQGVDVCRLLARRKEMSITTRNRDGLSAIHLAAIANNLQVLKLFAEEMGKNVEVFDNENRTPLHYAAEQGHYEIVQLLLACGARSTTSDKWDASPAHYAAQFSVSCLDIILAKNNYVEIKDRENRSCLMWAVCAGNVEVIEYLVRKTSPDRQARDNHGFTALHLAAMVGNENICKVLVRQGWNLSERDKLDNTPLHLAAGRGHTDVVRFLVTAGANMNEKDAMDRTPVYWACFGGQAHTLYCMIKELGFEWRTVDKHRRVPITDALGQTPLHAAAFAGFTACINVLLNIEAEDDCLISPLTGWKDKHGETALHIACSRGKMDCVLALLKGGAAPNAVNDMRKTCLQCAVDNKHSNIAEYLRSQGALLFNELSETAARVIQSWWRRVLVRRRFRKVRR
ncbi:hypothetical protein V3C99_013940 [Haemonchus contortus]|uniref:ANK_REP_REGION domain-containing protein n=1 Tax=Haemonchus contortus TaxID=6289 RepID=A0A7I4YR23_HAECO